MPMKMQFKERRFTEVKAWHRYSLQGLPTSRFALVVNKVLRGNDYVISLTPEKELEQKDA